MEEKDRNSTLNRHRIGIVALLVIAIASAAMLTHYEHTDITPATEPAEGAAVSSQFSFTGTAGWRQGATNRTSMALFQNNRDCFTSIQHSTGTIDAAEAKLQQDISDLTNAGYTVTPGATLTIALQIGTGQQSYKLQQSSVTTPAGSEAVEGGQEFGYLSTSNGYLFIEGYCNTPTELPATISALRAIVFKD